MATCHLTASTVESSILIGYEALLPLMSTFIQQGPGIVLLGSGWERRHDSNVHCGGAGRKHMATHTAGQPMHDHIRPLVHVHVAFHGLGSNRDVRVRILIWFQTFFLFTKPHFQTFNAVWMHWKAHVSFQAFQIISDFLTDALAPLFKEKGIMLRSHLHIKACP